MKAPASLASPAARAPAKRRSKAFLAELRRQCRLANQADRRLARAIDTGSGNVFVDLGYANAKERTLKVELAMEVNRLLRERGLLQAAAAKVLGIRQPHVSDLVRYRLERFSVERLMAFIAGLGRDVEIRIRPRRGRSARAAVRVMHG
jgi:predicted XRE-type DNA-binding protein